MFNEYKYVYKLLLISVNLFFRMKDITIIIHLKSNFYYTIHMNTVLKLSIIIYHFNISIY